LNGDFSMWGELHGGFWRVINRQFSWIFQQPGSIWSACLPNIDVLKLSLTFNIDISVENDV